MDKINLRKQCLDELNGASKQNCYMKDKLIVHELKKVIKAMQPKSILFYLPMKIEVDLRSIMNFYRKKYNIFVPFIVEESFMMVRYRLPLKRNSYGIYESPKSHLKIKDVDLIIVPVVGVDGKYKRVGFGKGMYDRFFHRLKKKPIVVFVQRKKCATKSIVTDSYDIQADFYLTPNETIYRGKKYDNRNSYSRRRCSRGCWSGSI